MQGDDDVPIEVLRKAALAVMIDSFGSDKITDSNIEKLVAFSRDRKRGRVTLKVYIEKREKAKDRFKVNRGSVSLQELFPSVSSIKEVLYGTGNENISQDFDYDLHNLRWRDLSLREFGSIGTSYLRKIAGEA